MTENKIDSSKWTGDLTGAPEPAPFKQAPIRRWQFIVLAALMPVATMLAWYEMIQLFLSGSLASRYGRVMLGDDPLPFIVVFAIWFGWGSLTAFIVFRAATSSRIRRTLLVKLRDAGRRAI